MFASALNDKMSAAQNHSKEFFELIRAIGETKSKQEEDKILIREAATLKTHIANNRATMKQMKEYVVRMLYCEMLGHEASFGYIHAIKLTSSNVLLEKRVGYLAVTLCLAKNHELMLLTIASLQRVRVGCAHVCVVVMLCMCDAVCVNVWDVCDMHVECTY